MTYSREKEYIRQAYMDGHLDITSGFESVFRFVEIMSGEMEAIIAISHCRFLSDDEKRQLLDIAGITEDSVREYKGWLSTINRERA